MSVETDANSTSLAVDDSNAENSPLKLAETLSRSKDFPWYQESYGSRLTPDIRHLLERYSMISSSDMESHIYQSRDLAWSVFPFPCIGEFWYLTLGLSRHPKYDELLQRLKQDASNQLPPQLIDLGTCLGQDLRKLVYDGVSPDQVLGVDVFAQFEAVGHSFFNDADRFSGRFVTADIFASDTQLDTYRGTQDVVTASMFLHSFDWDNQVIACKKMLQLAKGPGSWVMGALTSTNHAEEYWLKPPFVRPGVRKNVYMQNKDSFVRMWQMVGEETNTKLSIWAEYDNGDTVTKLAAEKGGQNFFVGYEQKLLWYKIEIMKRDET